MSPREPADRPRDGEPRVAEVLRPRAGRDGERLRHAGQLADAPRIARLAGRRVPASEGAGRLKKHSTGSSSRQRDLPPVVRSPGRDLHDEGPAATCSLGRQIRLRLEAEIIRDAALSRERAARTEGRRAGRLPAAAEGGVQLHAEQPRLAGEQGPDRYRRGMYTYIWRQSQHPLLTTFDGADAQAPAPAATAATRRCRRCTWRTTRCSSSSPTRSASGSRRTARPTTRARWPSRSAVLRPRAERRRSRARARVPRREAQDRPQDRLGRRRPRADEPRRVRHAGIGRTTAGSTRVNARHISPSVAGTLRVP